MGWAAVASLAFGLVGVYLGAAQVMFVGPIAKAIHPPFGMDIGFELGALFAGRRVPGPAPGGDQRRARERVDRCLRAELVPESRALPVSGDPLADPLLRDDWHVAARLTDLPPDRPLAVTMLGERLALWRQGDRVSAWKDLCLHRGAQLSLGRVAGGLPRMPLPRLGI